MADDKVAELLSKPWQKFLAKFDEINTLTIDKWKEPHLLGYFCQRYQKCYEQKFALSFRGAPSKCNEIYMMKKTMAMLDTTNIETVRDYIDWVFDVKIIPNQIKIRSIGFLTTPGFGNEFNQYRKKKQKIVKSTELPTKYQSIINDLDLQANTYGDLAFIKMALDQSPNSVAMEPYKLLFTKLVALDFETEVLNTL